MRIRDWSSAVCSSDLAAVLPVVLVGNGAGRGQSLVAAPVAGGDPLPGHALDVAQQAALVLGAEGNCLAVPAGTGDRKSTRLNSSHSCASRMPSSAGKKENRRN